MFLIHQNIHGFTNILFLAKFCLFFAKSKVGRIIQDFFVEILQPFLKLEKILNASQNVFHRNIKKNQSKNLVKKIFVNHEYFGVLMP